MTQLLLNEQRSEICSKYILYRRWFVVTASLVVQGIIIAAMVMSLRQAANPAIVLAPVQGNARACRIVAVAPYTDAWVLGLQAGDVLSIKADTHGCRITHIPLKVVFTGENSHLLSPSLRIFQSIMPQSSFSIEHTDAHPLGVTDGLIVAILASLFDIAGLAILLRAQDRPLARIACSLFYATSLTFCLISAGRYNIEWIAVLFFSLSMLIRGLSTTFVCLFPHPARLEARRRRLLPYIPLLVGIWLAATDLPLMHSFPGIRFLILFTAFIYNVACIIVVVWMLFWGLRKLNSNEQQLTRMVLVGIIFLLIPLALMLNVVRTDVAAEASIIHMMPIPLAVLPIACDYALFRHQLVGAASLISRRVMRVLLWLLLASLFVIPGIILLRYLYSTNLLQGDMYGYLFAAILVLSLCLFPLAWNKVRNIGDYVFYRDFYQYNRSLRELSADLTRIQRLDEIQSHVLPRLATLLNTNDVALLVQSSHKESTPLNEVQWNVYHYAAMPSALPGERLISIANRALTHLTLPSYEPLLFDGVLLLALYDGTSLRGFLCLGPKRNVEPYSRQDTSFLATLASQLAVLEVNHRYLMQAQTDAQTLAALNRRVVSAQEEERKHLALDLHDEVLQQAMLLVRQLSDAGTMSEVADAMPLARSVVTSLRRTCLELRPPLLDELGLEDALSWLARQTEQRSNGTMRVQMLYEGVADARPSAQVELALYRVGQEALSNALKYAQASIMTMRLRHTPSGGLSLLIHDNGRGFSKGHAGQGRAESLGLIGMYERMVSIGGKLQLRTSPGRGVTIRACYIPASVPVEARL